MTAAGGNLVRDKRWLAWMTLWFVVDVALWIWYMVGGPVRIIPITLAALLISLGPLVLKGSWLARIWYAAIWVFEGWFLWRAFH